MKTTGIPHPMAPSHVCDSKSHDVAVELWFARYGGASAALESLLLGGGFEAAAPCCSLEQAGHNTKHCDTIYIPPIPQSIEPKRDMLEDFRNGIAH